MSGIDDEEGCPGETLEESLPVGLGILSLPDGPGAFTLEGGA